MKAALQQVAKKNIELLKFVHVTPSQSADPFMVGQCLMDHFGKSIHSISNVDLSYNIKSGVVRIEKSKSLTDKHDNCSNQLSRDKGVESGLG